MGIDVQQYLYIIKKKMKAAVHSMNAYCNNKKMDYVNWLTPYKAVIHSQLEYCMLVLNYDDEELDRLDELQKRTLKQILKLKSDAHETTTSP